MSAPSADIICGRLSSAAPSGERVCSLLFAKTTTTLIAVEVSDVRWPWPLTFSTENWHSTHPCPGERLYQLWFFYFLLFSRMWQTDGQTGIINEHVRWRNAATEKKTDAYRIHTTVYFNRKEVPIVKTANKLTTRAQAKANVTYDWVVRVPTCRQDPATSGPVCSNIQRKLRISYITRRLSFDLYFI